MDIARYYLSKHDYLTAINRFKVIVTAYPPSSAAERGSVYAYPALGFRSQA